MTTLKQIEANRRNAQSSTGPRTEAGKERSSRNAVRHGLTAETVIEPLEDAEDYQAFEEAVAAGFDAETAVERELILRLASLLWRLRLVNKPLSIVRACQQLRPCRTRRTFNTTLPTSHCVWERSTSAEAVMVWPNATSVTR